MDMLEMYMGLEASLVGMGGVFTVLIIFYLLTKFMTAISARPAANSGGNCSGAPGKA